MHKSFLATAFAVLVISIAGMAAPVFAHEAGNAQPQLQLERVALRAPVNQPIQAGLLTPVNMQRSLQPLLQYSELHQQELNGRVAQAMEKNGHQVREYVRSVERDWNHHQVRQRKQHTMQG